MICGIAVPGEYRWCVTSISIGDCDDDCYHAWPAGDTGNTDSTWRRVAATKLALLCQRVMLVT